MNRKEKLIELVTMRLMTTSSRIDIEHQRLPNPQEFAIDIVEFFYGIADKDVKEEEKKKEKIRPATQDSPDGV